MQSWSRHVRGATALLLLRGQDSPHNNAGIALFLHLRQQIVGHFEESYEVTITFTNHGVDYRLSAEETARSPSGYRLVIQNENRRRWMAGV